MKIIPRKPLKSTWFLLLIIANVILVGCGTRHRTGVGDQTSEDRGTDIRAQEREAFDNDFIESFANELNNADDLDDEDRDQALRILREAAPAWSRVKQENRRAMQRANRSPRNR